MADILTGILRDTKENFQLLFVSLNPFKNIRPARPTDFTTRIKDTYGVFAGTSKLEEPQEDSVAPKRIKPIKRGIFGTLLGLPMQLVYFLVPTFFLAVGFLGAYAIMQCLDIFDDKKKGLFTKALLSPVALTLLAFGTGLALIGGIGYLASKAVLWPINKLVNKAIIPALAGLFTGMLILSVGFVHWMVGAPRKKVSINTHGPFGSLKPEQRGSTSFTYSKMNAKPILGAHSQPNSSPTTPPEAEKEANKEKNTHPNNDPNPPKLN